MMAIIVNQISFTHGEEGNYSHPPCSTLFVWWNAHFKLVPYIWEARDPGIQYHSSDVWLIPVSPRFPSLEKRPCGAQTTSFKDCNDTEVRFCSRFWIEDDKREKWTRKKEGQHDNHSVGISVLSSSKAQNIDDVPPHSKAHLLNYRFFFVLVFNFDTWVLGLLHSVIGLGGSGKTLLLFFYGTSNLDLQIDIWIWIIYKIQGIFWGSFCKWAFDH